MIPRHRRARTGVPLGAQRCPSFQMRRFRRAIVHARWFAETPADAACTSHWKVAAKSSRRVVTRSRAAATFCACSRSMRAAMSGRVHRLRLARPGCSRWTSRIRSRRCCARSSRSRVASLHHQRALLVAADAEHEIAIRRDRKARVRRLRRSRPGGCCRSPSRPRHGRRQARRAQAGIAPPPPTIGVDGDGVAFARGRCMRRGNTPSSCREGLVFPSPCGRGRRSAGRGETQAPPVPFGTSSPTRERKTQKAGSASPHRANASQRTGRFADQLLPSHASWPFTQVEAMREGRAFGQRPRALRQHVLASHRERCRRPARGRRNCLRAGSRELRRTPAAPGVREFCTICARVSWPSRTSSSARPARTAPAARPLGACAWAVFLPSVCGAWSVAGMSITSSASAAISDRGGVLDRRRVALDQVAEARSRRGPNAKCTQVSAVMRLRLPSARINGPRSNRPVRPRGCTARYGREIVPARQARSPAAWI